jgi:hypothetical protein
MKRSKIRPPRKARKPSGGVFRYGALDKIFKS